MKRRIKLVVSDLHLGLGRVLENGQMNPLEEFLYDDKFVEFLHFYTTGKYADYEVELILNGDIFNFLQVDYRGHYLTVITESVSLNKTKRIIDGHPQFFQAIRDFVKKEGNIVTYIVGNHDQCILWPGVRAYLNEALETTVRFKNIVYFVDGVHIEHGHMHEAANRLNPRKFFSERICRACAQSSLWISFLCGVCVEDQADVSSRGQDSTSGSDDALGDSERNLVHY